MSRHLYVLRNGELVEKHKAAPKAGSPFVISDSLPDTWNPLTKKRYSSKSRYYAETKAAGGEIVGNDPSGLKERGFRKANLEAPQLSLKRTIEQLRSR